MKLRPRILWSIFLLAWTGVLSGCSELTPDRTAANDGLPVGMTEPPSTEKHGKSFFFNTRSHEIEDSLGRSSPDHR